MRYIFQALPEMTVGQQHENLENHGYFFAEPHGSAAHSHVFLQEV